MSVGTADDMEALSYVDHFHETVGWEFTTAQDNSNVILQGNHEPLHDRGGLENDQVAEVRRMRVFISMSGDHSASGDQSELGGADARGVIGINSPAADEALPNEGDANGEADAVVIDGPDPGSTPGLGGQVNTRADDGDLMPFNVHTEVGYVNATDGAGGAGSTANQYVEVDFDRFEVGPVLDSNDSLDLTAKLIQDNHVDKTELEVSCRLTYRIHEIEVRRPELGL